MKTNEKRIWNGQEVTLACEVNNGCWLVRLANGMVVGPVSVASMMQQLAEHDPAPRTATGFVAYDLDAVPYGC